MLRFRARRSVLCVLDCGCVCGVLVWDVAFGVCVVVFALCVFVEFGLVCLCCLCLLMIGFGAVRFGSFRFVLCVALRWSDMLCHVLFWYVLLFSVRFCSVLCMFLFLVAFMCVFVFCCVFVVCCVCVLM